MDSLKDEVKRAWEAYKTVQEKAALKESDFTDELATVESARVEEKQLLVVQVNKMREDLDISNRRFELLLQENKEIIIKYEDLEKSTNEWQTRENTLMLQLEEARACSSSNAAIIREELRQTQTAMEVMRKDHASWMLQNHSRQEELEQSNLELGNSLAEAERLINRLKSNSNSEKELLADQECSDLRKQVTNS